MRLKKLLFYIATTLSIILAIFFGHIAITNLQQINSSGRFCDSNMPIALRNAFGCYAPIKWSDLVLFISFTVISFSLIVLVSYILFTKIKLSKSKKLLFYPATIMSVVLAVIFGIASITNLQGAYSNFLSGAVCGSVNLNVGVSGATCSGPTISWLDLILFISFTAISFSLIVFGVHILKKRKK